MLNYLKAEFRRIFLKKSIYITLGISLIGLILVELIRYNSLSQEGILNEINTIFIMLSLVGGGILFWTIYCDDLTAKTLPQIIGFGNQKWKIIIVKLIISVILTSLMFFLALGVSSLMFMLMGFNVHKILSELLMLTTQRVMLLVAVSSVASALVYGTSKTSLGIATYMLILTGIVGQLLSLAIKTIDKFTINSIVYTFIENPSISKFTPYLIYLSIFIILGMIAFNKKELEF